MYSSQQAQGHKSNAQSPRILLYTWHCLSGSLIRLSQLTGRGGCYLVFKSLHQHPAGIAFHFHELEPRPVP
ncbi:unnamed protein product [Rhodiola kirilowii]